MAIVNGMHVFDSGKSVKICRRGAQGKPLASQSPVIHSLSIECS